MFNISSRFFRYALIGGLASVVDWLGFYLLAILFNIFYLFAGTISFIAAVLFNYYLSINFLFQSGVRFSKKKEVLMVFGVSSIGLLINLFFLYLFSQLLSLDLMLSKISASFFTLFWNFSMRNYYIFKNDS